MLVVIKSGPGSAEAQRGLKLAKETSADIVLIQDGVYLEKQGAVDFPGTVYVLDDDVRLRGAGAVGSAKTIGYDELVDLMSGANKVVGMF